MTLTLGDERKRKKRGGVYVFMEFGLEISREELLLFLVEAVWFTLWSWLKDSDSSWNETVSVFNEILLKLLGFCFFSGENTRGFIGKIMFALVESNYLFPSKCQLLLLLWNQ